VCVCVCAATQQVNTATDAQEDRQTDRQLQLLFPGNAQVRFKALPITNVSLLYD